MRDVFYASPQVPRLLHMEAIKDTVARGVAEGLLAYVGKSAQGDYSTFLFKKTVAPAEIEISDDMFIISGAEAEKHIQPPQLTSLQISPAQIELHSGQQHTFGAKGYDQFGREMPIEPMVWEADGGEITQAGLYQAGEEDGEFLVKARSGQVSAQAKVVISKELSAPEKPRVAPKPKQLSWSGEIPSQKWTNFYMKLLTKLVKDGQLELMVSLKATPSNGLTQQQIEETKAALRELGLNDDVKTSE